MNKEVRGFRIMRVFVYIMKNYTGIKSNMLTAIKFNEIVKGKCFWNFKCDCGKFINQRVDKIICKKPQVTSCGCKKKLRYNSILDINEKLLIHLYYRYRKSAKQRNYSFNIPILFFSNLVQSNCFYCGAKPNRPQYNQNKKDGFILCNGVDRKDNNIGYIEQNCVSCCTICNRAKSSFTFDFFVDWIKNLKINSTL